jgi:four helix bundle protein
MRRFLFIARGSAHELESHLLIAREVDLITAEEWADLDSGVQQISAMLLRLAEAQD